MIINWTLACSIVINSIKTRFELWCRIFTGTFSEWQGYKYNQKWLNGADYPSTQTGDTITNAFSLPHTFGAGLTYVYDNRLTIGADLPINNGRMQNSIMRKLFQQPYKIAAGAEFVPNPYSRNYLKRVRYRVGGYYSDPYTKVDGQDGTREYGVSAGFGFPLFQSKSILNISGQYVRVSPKVKGMLEENYLKSTSD